MGDTLERLMIFIDGGSLFKGAKRESISVDYMRLIGFLCKGFNLIRVYYYTGIPNRKMWDKKREPEKEFIEKLNKQKRFLEGLEFDYNFHVTTKPLVLINNKRQEKGIDVNIACDILWHGLRNNYDAFILISGDKDLMEVLRRMKDNGKKVIVANFEDSISRDMRRLCDRYVDLTKNKNKISLSK